MQFLLTVHGSKDLNPYDSDEEMHEAFQRVGQFNQKLLDDGKWVMAGGLAAPERAVTVMPDGSQTDGPFFEASTFPSAFWLIEVEDENEAVDLTREAAEACAQGVEMRKVEH